MTEKLTYEEFVKQAILKLRTGDYKGIHTVYSGFNEAFRKYFDGASPIEITNQTRQREENCHQASEGWGHALPSRRSTTV